MRSLLLILPLAFGIAACDVIAGYGRASDSGVDDVASLLDAQRLDDQHVDPLDASTDASAFDLPQPCTSIDLAALGAFSSRSGSWEVSGEGSVAQSTAPGVFYGEVLEASLPDPPYALRAKLTIGEGVGPWQGAGFSLLLEPFHTNGPDQVWCDVHREPSTFRVTVGRCSSGDCDSVWDEDRHALSLPPETPLVLSMAVDANGLVQCAAKALDADAPTPFVEMSFTELDGQAAPTLFFNTWDTRAHFGELRICKSP